MQDQPAPTPETPEQPVPIAEQSAPAAAPAAGGKKKILLVEDDIALAAVYRSRLELEDFEIYEVNNGEQALQAAKDFQPDLILLDAMMPKISGFDMLDILRSTTETRDIRVIMMTALSSDDQRARGEQLGADRYLVKSQVGIEDVVHTVHEVLEDAAKGAPAATATAEPADNPAPAPTMSPAPSDTNPSSTLPEPTAPFTSPRPDNLGERVINPIPTEPQPSVASKIDDELASTNQPAAPAPVAPEPVATSDPGPLPPQPDAVSVPAPVSEPVVAPTPAEPVTTPAADDSAARVADGTTPAAPAPAQNEGEQKPPVA